MENNIHKCTYMQRKYCCDSVIAELFVSLTFHDSIKAQNRIGGV